MRNQAREAALNIIFSRQFNEDCQDALAKKVFKRFDLEREEDLLFATELVSVTEEHSEDLLGKIEEACHHYHVNRLNPMDKSILLLALSEICYFDDIPSVVSVSEATGLAKKYSSETSADFVNGVLAGAINK